MCGLAGVVRSSGVAAHELEALLSALHHRGPDDRGVLEWSPGAAPLLSHAPVRDRSALGLVHTRLAIHDLSPRGWQPMTSHDGSLQIVFNGEVYNFLELREELSRRGHRFASTSDTEVLLAAWQEWGPASLRRLVGMWAFALLDVARDQVVLARDAFGIKPLYLASLPDGTAFCSELPPLLPLLDRREADPEGVRDFLLKGLTDHRVPTMVRGIEQLPAGCWTTIDLAGGRGATHRWWRPPDARPLRIGPREAAEELRRLFLRSVDLHLRSDVPVGTALSGGVDSSAIVGAARSVGGQGLDLRAFSYVADDARLSEEHHARAVADAVGASLTTTTPTAEDLATDVDALVARQGEPFGSTSIYAQSRVFRLAREDGVIVLLDGQGADELFAGYLPFAAARVTSLLRGGHLLAAAGLARGAGALPGPLDARWYAARGAAGLLPRGLVLATRRGLGHEVVPAWLSREWFTEHGVPIDPREVSARPRGLREALRQSLLQTSLPMLLRYEDRNSMTYSLESRVPFLERDLVDFALRLPEGLLLDRSGTTKSVLRAALRGLVPDPVLDRRDKIGFETPERAWLTSLRPWVESVLASDVARSLPSLDLPALRTECEAVLEGRSPFGWHLWRALNLVRWTDVFGIDHP